MRNRFFPLFSILIIAVFALPAAAFAQTKEKTKWDDEAINSLVINLAQPGELCLAHMAKGSDALKQTKGDRALRESRAYIASSMVFCAYANDKNQLVLDNLEEAIKAEEFKSDLLYSGLYAAALLDKHDEAISIFKQLRAFNRAEIVNLHETMWWSLINSAENSSNPNENRIYVHSELAFTKYAKIGLSSGVEARFDFLLALIETESDKESIGVLLKTVTSPQNAALLLTNKKYDIVRTLPEFSQISDLNALVKKDEELWKKNYETVPNSMEVGRAYSEALRNSGKYNDALTLINTILEKAKKEPTYYTDAEDQKSWLLNEKAYVLFGMNKIDESIDTLKDAMNTDESGGDNVSQVINLADLQLGLGKYQDAIDTLTKVGKERTKYADSLILGINICASHKLGKADTEYDAGILALRSNGDDNLYTILETQLCFGRKDDAAQTFIKILETTKLTAGALLTVSAYKNPRAGETATEKQQREIYQEIFAMPTVKTAIDKYGRIIDLPFDLQNLR